MPLCEKCSNLDVETLRDNDVSHQPSLKALKDSAEVGCHLCQLFWASLRDCSQDAIDSHLRGQFYGREGITDTSIYLVGEFHDSLPLTNARLYTCPQSKILVYSGKYFIQTSPDSKNTAVYGHLTVYAEPGTKAAQRLLGRPTLQTKDYRVDFTKDYITSCELGHAQCKAKAQGVFPTRIIDVGSSANNQVPRLVLPKGESGCYVALSYCWGQGARDQIKLTKDTLKPFQDHIDITRLAQTQIDAITITRELGLQYLWIDALCIVQGDPEDWARESVKMAEIYGGAYLTIVAGCASDSKDGFLTRAEKTAIPPLPLRYSRPNTQGVAEDLCDVYVALPPSKGVGPVEERAWCFQEFLLSHRMIIYGLGQLRFKCSQLGAFEDGEVDTREHTTGLSDMLSGQSFDRDLMLTRWYGFIEGYSTRNLWEPHDVFAALAGIAKCIQCAVGGRYLAGLWENDLIRGLLWRGRTLVSGPFSKTPLTRPKEREGGGSVLAMRAPSWSWAAVAGPIWHTPRAMPTLKKRFAPDQYRIRPLASDGKSWTKDNCSTNMLHMPSCQLELRGTLTQVRVSTKKPSEYPKRMKWGRQVAKLDIYTALLEADELSGSLQETLPVGFQAVVGLGYFDVQEERPSSLYCLRLITDEGLMLQETESGTFRRLGVFSAEYEPWFEHEEQGKERTILLV